MKFLDAILQERKQNKTVVIPDIKCFSPKEGDLLKGRDPVQIARQLADAGAPVLSVVTEEKEFHGSLKLLQQVAEAVKVPVLRKDFIHSREDLVRTKEAGASAILLMCSCLEPEELEELYREALELGLDPFVETHNEAQMEQARALGAKLIGINNRNILELERDDGTVSTTCRLAHLAPEDAVLVSESSIQNSHEVRLAMEAGADCALVGTAIWGAKDPGNFYRSLIRKVPVKLCGMKRLEDVEICMEQGVDIIGVVVEYPKEIPWNLTREQAKPLIDSILPTHQSCMVTGGDTQHILSLARELRPDLVQIHFRETIEQTQEIARELHCMGIGLIKPFPVTDQQSMELYKTTDQEQVADLLCDAGVDVILVDAREADNVTSTDLKLDTRLYETVQRLLARRENPPKLYIAGGIRSHNVWELAHKLRPDCVDIMSGAEMSPGVKDADKICGIIEQINRIV